MTQSTELTHAAIKELEERLLVIQARPAAILASSMAEVIALRKLVENARSALQAARLDEPIAPIIAPLLRAVHGWRERTTSPDEAPKPRKVSTDLAGPPPIVPVLDGGEDAEPVEPVKRHKRKPDYVKQVKRAMAAGLNVRSANFTADGVSMTFGGAEAPVDDTVIETADELRKLI